MSRIILCPWCRSRVMQHDGRGTINIHGKCKGCNKLITYNPNTKETTISDVPLRDTSSGKRFY